MFRVTVAGAEDLPATDSAAGEQVGETVRPVIAAGACNAPRARIADPRFAAHLARDQHQRLIDQAARSEVLDQSRKAAVELGKQKFLEAVEIVAMRVPAAGALAPIGEPLVFHPEDGHKGDAGLDQPPGQKQARAVDRLSVTPAKRGGFLRDIERFGRLRG